MNDGMRGEIHDGEMRGEIRDGEIHDGEIHDGEMRGEIHGEICGRDEHVWQHDEHNDGFCICFLCGMHEPSGCDDEHDGSSDDAKVHEHDGQHDGHDEPNGENDGPSDGQHGERGARDDDDGFLLFSFLHDEQRGGPCGQHDEQHDEHDGQHGVPWIHDDVCCCV